MLVISRRENERFLFPNLGIAVQVIKVAGRVAKIGVEAPREIRVLREELLDQSITARQLPAEIGELEKTLPRELRHEFRNRLNPISLGLQVAQKLIETSRFDELELLITKLVGQLKDLDGHLPGNLEQPKTERLASVLADTNFDHEKLALVVDDNANERSLMSTLLELSGYAVVVVEDGQEAIEYLKQSFRKPDFVLLDMNMPRMNGPETIAEIRSNPNWQGLKVFAVSGSDRQDLPVDVGPQGVNRWFTKPLDARQLVEEMDRELQSA